MSSSLLSSLENEPAMFSAPFTDMPSRAMRVKILYTFDDENRTNCLARVPDLANVPTLPIDDEQQIGVIELRHCIRAVVAASPELLPRLTQGDFTIYAYDYSEYDTPLVGQGMLSSLLATMSPAPNAIIQQPTAMITGRVCKNALGVFARSCAETLEVKLRLVPVSRIAQHNYFKSMEAYRTQSPALSGGFDPNAWADFRSDGHLVDNLEQRSQDFALADSARESNSRNLDRRMSNASMNHNCMALPRQAGSRPSSRGSVQSERPSWSRHDSMAAQHAETDNDDGPARKRAKIMQTDWKGRSTFGDKTDSLRVTASTAASVRLHKPLPRRRDMGGRSSLEPPPRAPTPLPPNDQALQRARSLQASFLRRESSLMQSQAPKSPYDDNSDAIMSSPEDCNEALTADNSPVDFPSSPPAMPDNMKMQEPSSPMLPALPSLPRAADSGYMSGTPFEDMQDQEARADEKKRSTGKKRGRPTFPTQKSDISVVNFIDETPGPPELLPYTMNTAVMVANAALQDQRRSEALAKQQSQHRNFTTINDSAVPPTSQPLIDCQPARSIESGSSMAGVPAVPSTTSAIPSLRLSVDGQDVGEPPRSTRPSVNRNDAASPAPSEGASRNRRSGGTAKRKKIIKDKLLESLANGQMPQYCFNCGSIETPTWRSLHIRTVDGAPEDNEADEPDADSAGIEILERDEATKKVAKYRVIRSAQRKKGVDPDIYQTIQVCNPCGLWFNKFRYMRPSEKWNRAKATAKSSSRRLEIQSDAMELPSDFPQSDVPQSDFAHSDFPPSELWNEMPMPDDIHMTDATSETLKAIDEQQKHVDHGLSFQEGTEHRIDGKRIDNQSTLGPATAAANRPRPHSAAGGQSRTHGQHGQWIGVNTDAALKRAIRSSPVRFLGTQERPINLEEEITPKPTRRLLFPSPRRPGEVKALDDTSSPTGQRLQENHGNGNEVMDKPHTPSKTYSVDEPFVGMMNMDKENFNPQAPVDDDFARLFSPSLFKTPLKSLSANATMQTPPSKSLPTFESLTAATPTPSRRVISGGMTDSQQAILRTPGGRTMDEFLPSFSSAERRELLGTPSRYIPGGDLATPVRAAGRKVDGGDDDASTAAAAAATSLEMMTPFTRSWAQLLEDHHGALDFGLESGSDTTAFFQQQ